MQSVRWFLIPPMIIKIAISFFENSTFEIRPCYPRFIYLSIVKQVSMNAWQGLSVYRSVDMYVYRIYVNLVHASVTSIFASYHNNRYSFVLSLHSFDFIFSFTLRHYLSHYHHFILSASIVYIFFVIACLSVRALTLVDVCLWHILHHFIFTLVSIC